MKRAVPGLNERDRSPAVVLACLFAFLAGPSPLPAAEPGPCGAPIESPALEIIRDGQAVWVMFTGALESAMDPRGPWRQVTNAVSPVILELATSHGFLRARSAADGGIFDSCETAPLTVRGPLQTHFELAFAGSPDGIFPPRREKPYFDGTVRFAGFELPAQLRVRGNSSLQECPFPKLKLKLAREHRAGTPFEDAREIKVGTHCAEGGQGTIGRLRDQTAPFREVSAYEVMARLGFTTPRVRRVHITYQDTSPTNTATTAGWQLTRDGFLLEDVEVLGERMRGRALDDAEVAALANAGFEEELITALRLFHALLGNWDYALSTDGRWLWNTDVIALADGRLVPVAGDFDLASWVTGVVRFSAPRDYFPELGEVEREARYQIELIRKEVGFPSFRASRERFLLGHATIVSHLAEAIIDPAGRANALRHVAAFYDASAWVDSFDE